MKIFERTDFSLYPRFIVFTASFCLMVLEIVAGRIMAPHLGVSLYTWTSIIGVILAGISLGNYIGGKLADKIASSELLGMSFLFAGLSSLTIHTFASFMGGYLQDSFFSLPVATFLFSLFVFFIPSVLLSFITPIVIKLNLKNLDTTGSTVGKIYSFSAMGSILGTFAAGYFLIALFGTRLIVYGVSIILLLIGARLSLRFLKSEGKKFLIIFFIISAYTFLLPAECTVESNYYCINVLPFEKEIGGAEHDGLALQLDHLVHSYVDPDDPTYFGYDYEKVYALLAEYFKEKEDGKVLLLGGGGYVMPRFIEKAYPNFEIEVSEIDPLVTKINYDKLGLDINTKIQTHNIDARVFLQSLKERKQYDIILADVFNDLSVPYHLTTKEFNSIILNHLSDNGYYAVNIIDDYTIGSFLISYIHTLRQTFDYVALAPLKENVYDIANRYTYVVVAGKIPLEQERLEIAFDSLVKDTIFKDEKKEDILKLVSGSELDKFLSKKKIVLLTDDYVPVDNMLAPVFRNR